MSPLWVLLLSLTFVTIRAATPLPPPMTTDDFTNQTYRLVTTTPDKVGTYSFLGPQAVMPQGAVIVAEVIYNESYDELGWDFIQVTANTTLLSDDDRGRKAYFAAGYAEGYVSAVRMGQVYIGNGLQVPQPTNVMEWIKAHIAYMDEEVNINVQAGYPSPFWTQIGNHLAQLNGMAEGYMRAVIEGNRVDALNQPNLTFIDIFVLNFDNELGDVYNAVGGSSIGKREYKKHRSPLTYKTIDLHCSALVKVTSDDIYFSHVTWGGYNTMVRQYKIYRFQSTVSMTSVAGTIASGDDWYVTSNDLSVQETTNEFYNDALLAYITPSSASEFLRAMVANFIATDGPSWVALYQYNNSGTYCNQWMVLDWKLYSPGDTGDALADNLLWVAEQIPGNVTSADVTPTLRATSYWGSYNIPYFPHIYNVSGFTGLYEEYGPMFSYKKYARPEIFKRNHSNVVDLTSMRALMRYNNWQHDELSWIPLCDECSPRGSAWLAISSRGDLAGTNGWVGPTNPSYAGMFAQSANGGIDAKIMSYAQLRQGAMGNVICGPTYDQQPVFDFDATFPGTRPPGSANLFAFPWTFFNEVNRTLQ